MKRRGLIFLEAESDYSVHKGIVRDRVERTDDFHGDFEGIFDKEGLRVLEFDVVESERITSVQR